MIDLVERLRTSWDVDRSIISQTSGWDRERKEAADEITALRARLDAAEKERAHHHKVMSKRIAMQRKELRWMNAYTNAVLRGYNRILDTKNKADARTERAEAALATARRDALLEVANMKPTREQIANAAMGYDHSFGLMTPAEQENLMHRAGWWLNAWQHVIRALANEAET